MKKALLGLAACALAAVATTGASFTTQAGCTVNVGRCSNGNCKVNYGTCEDGGDCTVTIGHCDSTESDLVAL